MEQKLVNELMDKILDLFISHIPRDIMSTYKGTEIMYATILNLIYRFATALNLDQETVAAQIRAVWDISESRKGN